MQALFIQSQSQYEIRIACMHKWSENPKNDMQTLKAYDHLFKKGYWTKEGIDYYYCWFGVLEQQQQLGLRTESSANEGLAVRYLP